MQVYLQAMLTMQTSANVVRVVVLTVWLFFFCFFFAQYVLLTKASKTGWLLLAAGTDCEIETLALPNKKNVAAWCRVVLTLDVLCGRHYE